MSNKFISWENLREFKRLLNSNFKTVNNQSIIGQGNIEIASGDSAGIIQLVLDYTSKTTANDGIALEAFYATILPLADEETHIWDGLCHLSFKLANNKVLFSALVKVHADFGNAVVRFYYNNEYLEIRQEAQESGPSVVVKDWSNWNYQFKDWKLLTTKADSYLLPTLGQNVYGFSIQYLNHFSSPMDFVFDPAYLNDAIEMVLKQKTWTFEVTYLREGTSTVENCYVSTVYYLDHFGFIDTLHSNRFLIVSDGQGTLGLNLAYWTQQALDTESMVIEGDSYLPLFTINTLSDNPNYQFELVLNDLDQNDLDYWADKIVEASQGEEINITPDNLGVQGDIPNLAYTVLGVVVEGQTKVGFMIATTAGMYVEALDMVVPPDTMFAIGKGMQAQGLPEDGKWYVMSEQAFPEPTLLSSLIPETTSYAGQVSKYLTM